MQEIPESCGALCLKRNDASFRITIFVFSKTETSTEIQENTLPYSKTRDVPKARQLVIKGLELDIQLAALRRRRCWTEPTKTSSKVEKRFPKTWKELSTFVKEKKNTLAKSCKESSKREAEMYTMSGSMADDAKVEDGNTKL